MIDLGQCTNLALQAMYDQACISYSSQEDEWSMIVVCTWHYCAQLSKRRTFRRVLAQHLIHEARPICHELHTDVQAGLQRAVISGSNVRHGHRLAVVPVCSNRQLSHLLPLYMNCKYLSDKQKRSPACYRAEKANKWMPWQGSCPSWRVIPLYVRWGQWEAIGIGCRQLAEEVKYSCQLNEKSL